MVTPLRAVASTAATRVLIGRVTTRPWVASAAEQPAPSQAQGSQAAFEVKKANSAWPVTGPRAASRPATGIRQWSR
jgi:hypothetical protein